LIQIEDRWHEVFKGKRVLVTGHTGFKGSWLTVLLKMLEADVMGYALPPRSQPSHFSLLGIENDIKHEVGDIRDLETLKRILSSFEPEFVFHLAAQPIVKTSYGDPVETFSVNVMGAVNILDAVKCVESVRSFVFITSDKCYENVEWVWGYRETDVLGGRDPYSASKGCAEIIFSSYLRSFFDGRDCLGLASARAGNVIGGGDWSENRIIPDCIRAVESDKPIILRNPDATRPWQHVLEPLSGYLMLAARQYTNPLEYRGAWNFGPFDEGGITVKQVAEAIVRSYGRGSIEVDNADHDHEAGLLSLNCDKARRSLGWSPRWSSVDAIEATARWYQGFRSGRGVRDLTESQVQDYFLEAL
jgi:CDP-glucose 4,6-dehydratase